MAESDKIIREKVVARNNVAINITKFYKMIKTYLKEEKGYTDFNEKSHEETVSGGLKNTKIKFEGRKKIDDYTEFKIELTIKMNDYKMVLAKGDKLAKGDLKVEFDASLENDYNEKWEEGIFKRLARGFYDKFILGSHFNKLAEEVKEECLDTVDEVKTYLNMVKER